MAENRRFFVLLLFGIYMWFWAKPNYGNEYKNRLYTLKNDDYISKALVSVNGVISTEELNNITLSDIKQIDILTGNTAVRNMYLQLEIV